MDQVQEKNKVSKDRTSQEEGLAPAAGLIKKQRGQAPLPDLFYPCELFFFVTCSFS